MQQGTETKATTQGLTVEDMYGTQKHRATIKDIIGGDTLGTENGPTIKGLTLEETHRQRRLTNQGFNRYKVPEGTSRRSQLFSPNQESFR